MNVYQEMRLRHQQEVNQFPMKFAFTQEGFERGMRELDLDPATDAGKVIAIAGCGFIREADKEAFIDLFRRHSKEMEDAIRGDTTGEGFAYWMFRSELANHEYAYTRDVSSTLDAIGYALEEIAEDYALYTAFLMAREDYLTEAEEKGWGC